MAFTINSKNNIVPDVNSEESVQGTQNKPHPHNIISVLGLRYPDDFIRFAEIMKERESNMRD